MPARISGVGLLRETREALEEALADLGDDTTIAVVADGHPARLDLPTVVVTDRGPGPLGPGFARVANPTDETLEAAARLAAAGYRVISATVIACIELPVARSDIRIVSAFHRAGNRTRAAGLVGFSRSHYNRKLREACDRLRVERPIDAVLVLDRLGLLP